MLITIDGPVGVGKSTVARQLACMLDIIHLDSGALYRSLCYFGLKENISPNSIPEYLKKNCDRLLFSYKNSSQHIFIDEESAEQKIRSNRVTQKTKLFAESPECRNWVNSLMKKVAKVHSLVVDGRDIGTIVFPEAEFKFYLSASIEVRAQRRAKENNIFLDSSKFEILKKKIKIRDEQDKTRVIAPLIKAKDAIYLDSSEMNQEQVVDFFFRLIRKPSKKN